MKIQIELTGMRVYSAMAFARYLTRTFIPGIQNPDNKRKPQTVHDVLMRIVTTTAFGPSFTFEISADEWIDVRDFHAWLTESQTVPTKIRTDEIPTLTAKILGDIVEAGRKGGIA